MKPFGSPKLKDPSFTLIVFGCYSGTMGAVLLFTPRVLLPLFGVREAVNASTFMLGFVLLCSTFSYVASALTRDLGFARLTVFTRLAAPIVGWTLYLTGNGPLDFGLFGIVDALGGARTGCSFGAGWGRVRDIELASRAVDSTRTSLLDKRLCKMQLGDAAGRPVRPTESPGFRHLPGTVLATWVSGATAIPSGKTLPPESTSRGL